MSHPIDIPSMLQNIDLGPAGEFRELIGMSGPGSEGCWAIDPTLRLRGCDFEEEWEEVAWEENYMKPVSKAAQTWLDKTFGEGMFVADVGEKGHVGVSLTSKGKELFL